MTGTPGTGKTSLCSRIAQDAGFTHINVGEWVKDKGLHSGWDEEFQCHILDDDKVRCVPGTAGRKCLERVICMHTFAWPQQMSHILSHEQVCDALEDIMEAGGCVVDHHGCDLFPER